MAHAIARRDARLAIPCLDVAARARDGEADGSGIGGGRVTRVTLEGLAKSFGADVAVHGLDLDVPEGSLCALLGPSGCGKTTTLRMIAGLERPSGGRVLFDGADVTAVPPRERDVGMVFQRYALFPHMSVAENVSFGPSVRGIPRGEARARVDAMLDVVRLGELRHRFPAQLSGGQMQRVAIARTLVNEPRILLMDEPLANLDTALRGEMRGFIRDLQRRLGITTILVTHDQTEAMELADRVAVMLDGHLAQWDAPERLYAAPANLDVARFLGARNVLAGRIVGEDRVGLSLGTLAIAPGHGLAPGTPVHAVLREEAIDMVPGEGSEGSGGLAGRVAARTFHGSTASYEVEATGGPAARVIVTEPARRSLDIGTPVRLQVPPERVHLIPGDGTPPHSEDTAP